ncbi:MAG: PAS domain S-box protein, partial [Planctomycetales bacterium]|nr:PAS domain S-box protein [Planctomycetales bacterium]
MSTKSSNPQIVGTSPEQRVVAIPAMVWICRPDGSAESFCGQWHALLGQTTAEAVGWGWVNVIHPLERRQVLDAWKDAVSSGRDCEIETRLKMANGEYRRHVITATPVRDALGDIQNWCSVCKDVDGEIQYEHWERSETQRELAKEKAVLQAIVNGLPDAVLLGDLERRLTFCNPGAYQMFGYEDGELVGKFGLDLLANEADKVDYAATIFHREAPRKFRTTEAEWLRKNGEKFLGEMVGTVIQNEAGAPIGYLALLRDITNRRQAELALRKREQHYRTVVETAGCVVAFMSAENKILEWNWEAERLLGYSLAEV